jgi:hypothetical protein
MRGHHRDVYGFARLEGDGQTAGPQALVPRQFARSAQVIAFLDRIGCVTRVACGELRHHLRALHLQQDIVLGVEVIGRHRVRAGSENEPLRRQHFAGGGLDRRSQFFEQRHQQGFVGRDLLDILEHCPAVAGGNMPDRFADGHAVGTGLAVDPDRQIAAIVLDRCGGQVLAQLRKPVQRQARVGIQPVAQDMRRFRIAASKGGHGLVREHADRCCGEGGIVFGHCLFPVR